MCLAPSLNSLQSVTSQNSSESSLRRQEVVAVNAQQYVVLVLDVEQPLYWPHRPTLAKQKPEEEEAPREAAAAFWHADLAGIKVRGADECLGLGLRAVRHQGGGGGVFWRADLAGIKVRAAGAVGVWGGARVSCVPQRDAMPTHCTARRGARTCRRSFRAAPPAGMAALRPTAPARRVTGPRARRGATWRRAWLAAWRRRRSNGRARGRRRGSAGTWCGSWCSWARWRLCC